MLFEGITSHILLPKVVIENESDLTVEEASFVTSYIPVIDNNLDFPVDAVFEINTNITSQWRNITSLEQKAFYNFYHYFYTILL